MNLKNLSDDVLLQSIESHARDERKSGLAVLWHLREIERRMLYAKLQYGSLFSYTVKHLHYSEGAAMRRIDAMRLLREMPELALSIESGELSLTNLSLIKQAVKDAKKSTIETKALLEEVKGKTKKECERILAREMPQTIPEEKERVLTPTHTEVRVVLNEKQLFKLNRLRSLLSNQNPNPSYAELIEMLSDLALKKLDPMESKRKPTPPKALVSSAPYTAESVKDGAKQVKPVPLPLRRKVFQDAKGECANCGNMHFLEIDHILPRAMGGMNEPRNLRVLCRSCNQYEATRLLGTKLMQRYFPKCRSY